MYIFHIYIISASNNENVVYLFFLPSDQEKREAFPFAAIPSSIAS